MALILILRLNFLFKWMTFEVLILTSSMCWDSKGRERTLSIIHRTCGDGYKYAYYALTGTLLETRSQKEDAAAIFREALQLFPDDVYFRSHLSLCLCSLRQYAAAEVEAHATLAKNPNNVVAFTTLAFVSESRGKLLEAKEWLRKVVEIAPTDLLGQLHLIRIQVDLGEYQDAREEFDRLGGVARLREEYRYEAANLCKIFFYFESAERILAGHLKNYPNDAGALLILGQLRESQYRFDDALQIYAKVQEGRLLGSAQFHAAQCQLSMGRGEDGMAALELCLKNRPIDILPLTTFSELCLLCDKPSKALSLIESLQKEVEESAYLNILRIRLLKRVGRDAESMELFREIEALDKRDWAANEYVEWTRACVEVGALEVAQMALRDEAAVTWRRLSGGQVGY